MSKYCFIGDLHGRLDTLDRILSKCPDHHYVFLGDIIHHKHFFKRTRKTSPLKMINRVRKLSEDGRASVVLGNNENYVLKHLVFPKTKIQQKEVRHTLSCLRNLSLPERLEILNWLTNIPLTLEIESDGITYRCAHAYYDPSPGSRSREDILVGIGYPWFRNDDLSEHIDTDPRFQYFFGHYGYPYFRRNLRILDATNFEGVGVYLSDRDEFMIYY